MGPIATASTRVTLRPSLLDTATKLDFRLGRRHSLAWPLSGSVGMQLCLVYANRMLQTNFLLMEVPQIAFGVYQTCFQLT